MLRDLFKAFQVDFKIRNLFTIDREFIIKDETECFELLAHPKWEGNIDAWPGNIRQYSNFCRNLLRNAFFSQKGNPVCITQDMVVNTLNRIKQLWVPDGSKVNLPSFTSIDETDIRRNIEHHKREAVRLAVEGGGYIVARCARLYGVQDATFRKYMEKHGYKPKKR